MADKKAGKRDRECGTHTGAVQLDHCDLLKAVPHVECTHFHQFVLLRPREGPAPANGDASAMPVAVYPPKQALKDLRFRGRLHERSRAILESAAGDFVFTRPGIRRGKIDPQKAGTILKQRYLEKLTRRNAGVARSMVAYKGID